MEKMNKNLQNETTDTYIKNFDKYTERTPKEVSGEFKEWIDSFVSNIPIDGKILEIGSATGRDARYFKSKGLSVTCTDIIPEALEQLNKDGFKTEVFDFKDEPKNEWTDSFDGFFANAVLLHAPEDIFLKNLSNILKVLKNDGVAAFSLKTGEGEEVSFEKMEAPRYFKYYSKKELEDILSKYSFEIISLKYADDQKWLQVILKKI
jgi:SAM-dependent methyltransferase